VEECEGLIMGDRLKFDTDQIAAISSAEALTRVIAGG
jgi:hypothetical protein